MAGSGRVSGSPSGLLRFHSIFSGCVNAARRSPTISGHATITSDVAKPCRARLGPNATSRKSASGFALGLGLRMGSGLVILCVQHGHLIQSSAGLFGQDRYPTLMLPSDQRATKTKADDLLAWYDRHRRGLPWRSGSGESADPYRVWLSEIMLQQTTVAAVK